jgi:hypothetical protein
MYCVYTSDRTLTWDWQAAGLPPTQDNIHTQNKECSHTAILQVGFEPTIPVFNQWRRYTSYTIWLANHMECTITKIILFVLNGLHSCTYNISRSQLFKIGGGIQNIPDWWCKNDWNKIWCTLTVPFSDPSDMVVLPSAGTLCYHNCCIYGGTSVEYFGYHLVYTCLLITLYLAW